MDKYQRIRLILFAGVAIGLCSIVIFVPAENWIYFLIALILSGALYMLLNRE